MTTYRLYWTSAFTAEYESVLTVHEGPKTFSQLSRFLNGRTHATGVYAGMTNAEVMRKLGYQQLLREYAE